MQPVGQPEQQAADGDSAEAAPADAPALPPRSSSQVSRPASAAHTGSADAEADAEDAGHDDQINALQRKSISSHGGAALSDHEEHETLDDLMSAEMLQQIEDERLAEEAAEESKEQEEEAVDVKKKIPLTAVVNPDGTSAHFAS